jgi:hypothetical protein
MTWQEFTVDVVRSLAWPVAVLAIAFSLRPRR